MGSLVQKVLPEGKCLLDGTNTALLTAGMGMGIGGVAHLSTIIAAPVVLSLEIAALE